jgi:hypothetical protein
MRATRTDATHWACDIDVTKLAVGRWTLIARATDAAGNTGRDAITIRVARTSTPAAQPTPTPTPTPTATPPAPPSTPVPPAADPKPTPPADGDPVPDVDGSCTPAPFPARLHSDAPGTVNGDVSRAFVDPAGCKVTLNGFNIFPMWTNGSGLAFDRSHYQSIRAKGFNALRFVMPWWYYEPARGSYPHLGRLDQAIALAREAGLYVILDTVHIDGWNKPPAWTGYTASMGRAKEVDYVEAQAKGWIQTLARRYKDEPTVAGYDLVNEPPTSDQNRILRAYSTMISWVREVDPNKIVLTNAGFGNSNMSPAHVDPANLKFRKNVVHTWHDYFAGDGSGSVSVGYNQYGMNGGNQVWDATKGYPSGTDQADFEAQVKLQTDYARRAGVAVYVGEYGIAPNARNALAWAEQKTAVYKKHGLSRTWWLYKCQDSDFAPKTASCAWKPIVDRTR